MEPANNFLWLKGTMNENKGGKGDKLKRQGQVEENDEPIL